MLQALHDRLDKVEKGEVPSFQQELAGRVLTNTGRRISREEPDVSQRGEHDLNDEQAQFLDTAIDHDISWLWGPPGTGKTQTLGLTTRNLYERGQRTLICSNTNQAVDECLLKICEQLNSRSLEEGMVLRLGKIAHIKLQQKFGAQITVDGIVARRSVERRNRMAQLELELQALNSQVAEAERILVKFDSYDHSRDLVNGAESNVRTSERELLAAESSKRKSFELTASFAHELARFKAAGTFRRMLLRSEAAITDDLTKAEKQQKQAVYVIGDLENRLSVRRKKLASLSHDASALSAELAQYNRATLQRDVQAADRKRQPFRDELAQIAAELEKLRDVILAQARVVGATITRTYLRPNEFPPFDAVIVDEASMILLPMTFYAAGLSRKRVIIAGDFRQLPPILQTEQKAIFDVLGHSVFEKAGVPEAVKEGAKQPANLVMLQKQYRMHESFGGLVSRLYYEGRLKPVKDEQSSADAPGFPSPLNQRVTIVDTSRVWPFVTRDTYKSRYNLMHALVVRNIVLHLKDHSKPMVSTGVCVPYAAQSKLLNKILNATDAADRVRVATVHGFQGGEQDLMILDLVDSVGERNVGLFLQAESVEDVGAKLQNVALSRAKKSVVVVANLTYLDQKLPGNARLRALLYELQRVGTVVDVKEVLSLRPVLDDLRRFGDIPALSPESSKTGLFNGRDFAIVARKDMETSKASIVIFSGFITPDRVAHIGEVLRHRIASGVKVRCVTRPPTRNGSIPEADGRAALKALQSLGCSIDLRSDIHEKVVIIDGHITWFGSLNPLSHTAKTSEIMSRVEDSQFATQVAAQLAVRKKAPTNDEGLTATIAENPRCEKCGTWSVLCSGRFGRFFACLDKCGWTQNVDRPKQAAKTRMRTKIV